MTTAGHRARDLAEALSRTAVVLDGIRSDLGGWSGPLRVEVERAICEIASDLAGAGSTLSWRGAQMIEMAAVARAAISDGTPPDEGLLRFPVTDGIHGSASGGPWAR